MINYSILVNTCDKFDDCWGPFFVLFSKYWNDCNAKIYLNTEFKDYSFSGINVIPIKGCEGKNIPPGKYATWSQCLKWALDKIDSELILYMQEDYFIKSKVNNQIVEKYIEFMNTHKEVMCIHLTDQGMIPSSVCYDQDLYIADRSQKYYVSCQAAIWRKEELYKILRERETAWEFEKLGSIRAKAYKGIYLAIDRSKVILDKSEIIPYIFTGIVKGKWIKGVPSLFNSNNIFVDYSKRGFWEPHKSPKWNVRLLHFVDRIPNILKNYCDLMIIKTLRK